MRQSIGGVWLFTLIITFTLLFSGFLVVTLNYARAYRVKNEVISFIEREEGLTDRESSQDPGAIQLINSYLENVGYNEMGKCPTEDNEKWYGAVEIRGNTIYQSAREGVEYYYCVKKNVGFSNSNEEKAYYNVRLFFNFNLPVFGELMDFRVEGSTTQIEYPSDKVTWDRIN